MRAITLWQPWASLCVIPRPCVCVPYWPEGHPAHVCACDRSPFKTIETRSWKAPDSLIGQRIAIHAAKRPMRDEGRPVGQFDAITHNLLRDRSVGERMIPEDRVLAAVFPDGRYIHKLPFGAVIGTAVLADCVPIHHQWCRCSTRTAGTLSAGLSVGDFGGATTRYMSIGVGGLGREILGLYREDGLAYSRTNSNLDQHPWTIGRDDEGIIAQIPFGHFDCGRWAWLLADAERFAEPVPATGRQGIWNWERP